MRMRLPCIFSFAIAFMATLFFSCRKMSAAQSIWKILKQLGINQRRLIWPPVYRAEHLPQTVSSRHGTNGYATELKIAGMSYSELVEELNEFRAKDPKANYYEFLPSRTLRWRRD